MAECLYPDPVEQEASTIHVFFLIIIISLISISVYMAGDKMAAI